MDQATFERVQRPICDMRLTLKAKKEAYSKKREKYRLLHLAACKSAPIQFTSRIYFLANKKRQKKLKTTINNKHDLGAGTHEAGTNHRLSCAC